MMRCDGREIRPQTNLNINNERKKSETLSKFAKLPFRRWLHIIRIFKHFHHKSFAIIIIIIVIIKRNNDFRSLFIFIAPPRYD